MKPSIRWAMLGLIALTAILATAATPGDKTPKATYGTVQVASYDGGSAAADGGVYPTKIFTGLPGRNAYAIFNNGPVTVYCGFDKSITPSTGFPVAAGSSLSIDLVWNASGDKDLYCIGPAATRDQDAPSDTRWIQVK